MAQGKKKRSKGRQKSKAAQQAAQLKAEQSGTSGALGSQSSTPPTAYKGGMMSSMRGGFQSAVGQGDTKGKPSLLNNVIWIALIAAAVFLLVKQF